MGRREVAGLLFAAVLTGGIAAVIGVTALPPHSPYFDALRYFGFSACFVGFVGLAALLVFPGWLKSKDEQPIPPPLLEAQLAELREVEDFIARKSEGELRDTFDFPNILEFNVKMIRRQFGHAEPGVEEFFQGGEGRLDPSRVKLTLGTGGQGHHAEPIDGRVGWINVSAKYVQSRATLNRMADSPRLPTGVIRQLKRLNLAVETNSTTMTAVLDEAMVTDQRRFTNYANGGAPEYAWINNTYWHRFQKLKPIAEDVGAEIRKYLGVR